MLVHLPVEILKGNKSKRMTLRERQSLFCFNISKLTQFSYVKGFEFTMGEGWRSEDTQKIYVATGRSKTLDSLHPLRLAQDYNIFYQGRMLFADPARYVEDLELVRPLGEYWESLNTANRWGGDWNQNRIYDEKFKDPYHFEMRNV